MAHRAVVGRVGNGKRWITFCTFLMRRVKLKCTVTTVRFILNLYCMGIILWIIFGGIVGWIASLIMKTDGSQGPLLNIIVGIIGAVLGGWIMSFIGKYGVTGFNLYSFLVALLGAVVLIAIVKAIR